MTISADIRELVRATYNYQCGYCGVTEMLAGGRLEIDHFHPVSHGGLESTDNLIYACTTCNRFKGDYWPPENAPENLLAKRK
jgi:5-methylcytosine-specific restriction endonuclease McrA